MDRLRPLGGGVGLPLRRPVGRPAKEGEDGDLTRLFRGLVGGDMLVEEGRS